MYLGIDIGGTKTLLASLDKNGVILEQLKFPTPNDYGEFIRQLTIKVEKLTTKTFVSCGVGVPGRLDRRQGVGIAMGNLPWKHVTIKTDIEAIVHCPVVVENDAKLAGLSEAMLLKDRYSHVAYITISTGIGLGIVNNQTIDPSFLDSEAGMMPLEHHGKMVPWESFASGKAIVQTYGKRARDITDETTWRQITYNIAVGLINIIAILQPEVIVLGGSVANCFDRFYDLLNKQLRQYETPLVPIPPIIHAARPEQAVIYGCYDLAKSLHGTTHP